MGHRTSAFESPGFSQGAPHLGCTFDPATPGREAKRRVDGRVTPTHVAGLDPDLPSQAGAVAQRGENQTFVSGKAGRFIKKMS